MPSKTPRAADAVPMVVRVAHKAPSVIRVEGTIISRLRRPIRLEPSGYHSAQRVLWYREGGECWHVRPRMIYVPSLKTSIRDNFAHTPYGTRCTVAPSPRIPDTVDGTTVEHVTPVNRSVADVPHREVQQTNESMPPGVAN